MADSKANTGTGNQNTPGQNTAGGAGNANQPDPARNVGNNSTQVGTGEASRQNEREPQKREVSNAVESEKKERDAAIRKMSNDVREGEREVMRQAGRDPNTVVPEDNAGRGNPSVESEGRTRTKNFRDSEDTTLQENYLERDITNIRQQTTDSPYRHDLIIEQNPKIPPSMIMGAVGKRVPTPEDVAQSQDPKVYEGMRAPNEEELYRHGVHPDQQNAEVRERMQRRGVTTIKEAEEANKQRQQETEKYEQDRAEKKSGQTTGHVPVSPASGTKS